MVQKYWLAFQSGFASSIGSTSRLHTLGRRGSTHHAAVFWVLQSSTLSLRSNVGIDDTNTVTFLSLPF